MDFLLWHPEGKKCYFAGNMQLAIDSDTFYLVAPGAKSHYLGHFYLGDRPNYHNYNKALHNVLIHTKCCILNNIMCSVVEAECGGLFNNNHVALGIGCTLEAIGHAQRLMRIKTDNKTENYFVHASMQAKHSKT